MQSSHGHRNLIGGLHYRRSVTVGNFCTDVQSHGPIANITCETMLLQQDVHMQCDTL